MTMPAQSSQRPLTGMHVALMFISFFAVVIAVNVTLAVLASSTWTGLLVDNAYVASQHFNEETARREAFKAKGYQFGLALNEGLVSVSVVGQGGQKVAMSNATLVLGRKANDERDLDFSLDCQAGQCSARLDLAPGQWSGEVKVDVQGFGPWRQPIELSVTGE